MSHVVSIQSKLRDPAAIAAACQRLGLAAPVQGTAELYSGRATGLLIQLPDWQYPIVIDPITGNISFDNFAGRWGNQQHLDRFVQIYAVEKCRLEARKKNLVVTEQALQDGWTLLTYLSDHESDVFVVATSNDISKLPPEFSRAERWDSLLFLDLPTAQEKESIWGQYRSLYGIPEGQSRPDDTAWTGAEVRSCCRLAALLEVPLTEAAQHVVPVAVTAAEQVERLPSWASGRCLSASAPGIYLRAEGAPKSGRRVQRGPSDN